MVAYIEDNGEVELYSSQAEMELDKAFEALFGTEDPYTESAEA